MTNVVDLKGHLQSVGAGYAISANSVLAGARSAKLQSVVVVGREADGSLYLASTSGEYETVFELESAKARFFS